MLNGCGIKVLEVAGIDVVWIREIDLDPGETAAGSRRRERAGVAKDEYVIRYWSELLTREIAEKVRECARVAARVKELEEQVKQF